jgi:hypothetical protein
MKKNINKTNNHLSPQTSQGSDSEEVENVKTLRNMDEQIPDTFRFIKTQNAKKNHISYKVYRIFIIHPILNYFPLS